jgi:hypothetical protein
LKKTGGPQSSKNKEGVAMLNRPAGKFYCTFCASDDFARRKATGGEDVICTRCGNAVGFVEISEKMMRRYLKLEKEMERRRRKGRKRK